MQRECVHAAIVFRLFASIATSGVHRSPSVLPETSTKDEKLFRRNIGNVLLALFGRRKKREHISIDMTVNVMPLVHYRFRFSASNGVLMHCRASIYNSRTAISTARAVIGLWDMSFRFDLFPPPQWYFDKCYDGYVIIPIDERGGLNTHRHLQTKIYYFRVTGLRWLTIKTRSVHYVSNSLNMQTVWRSCSCPNRVTGEFWRKKTEFRTGQTKNKSGTTILNVSSIK